ncbi:unnamed protein product [Effrenium voratum]|nr:unnamed protein product [Effrenium voratum]
MLLSDLTASALNPGDLDPRRPWGLRLVVEKARDNPSLMGGLQSFSWACRGFGAILSAYFSGALLEMIGVQQVFAITACLPLLVVLAAVLIQESEAPEATNYSWEEAKQSMEKVWQVVSSPAVFPSVCFILAWQATPTAGSAMFYFYTNELHFNPEFLGRSQLAGSLASFAGIVLYNRVFSTVPLRDYLFRIQSIAVLLGFLPLLLVTRSNLALGIPDQAFVLGDDVIQTVAGELAHMPILVMAAQLCPPGIEATLFALLMSLLNLASFVSSNLGALITHFLAVNESDFQSLPLLVLLCNLSGVLPLAPPPCESRNRRVVELVMNLEPGWAMQCFCPSSAEALQRYAGDAGSKTIADFRSARRKEYMGLMMLPSCDTKAMMNPKPPDFKEFFVRWNIIYADLGLVISVAQIILCFVTFYLFSLIRQVFVLLCLIVPTHMAWYALIKRGGCMGKAGYIGFGAFYLIYMWSRIAAVWGYLIAFLLELILAVPGLALFYACLGLAGFVGGDASARALNTPNAEARSFFLGGHGAVRALALNLGAWMCA